VLAGDGAAERASLRNLEAPACYSAASKLKSAIASAATSAPGWVGETGGEQSASPGSPGGAGIEPPQRYG
jgi:hypothetical protein